MSHNRRRELMWDWVEVGLEAVEPRHLVGEAISAADDVSIIALGKAAVGMSWGAHDALGTISGICVTGDRATPPPGVELFVGDHPVPGEQSFEAGRRVLDVARGVDGRCVALISGGASSLCEHPRPGVDQSYLAHVTRVLLDAGAPIDEINLVRQHLSAIKGGGVSMAAPVPIETLLISDVCGRDPGLVASGPTIANTPNPDGAEELLTRYGIDVGEDVRAAIRARPDGLPAQGPVIVLADGRTAADAIVGAARQAGVDASLSSGWIEGSLEAELAAFVESSPPGLTVRVGEPTLRVEGPGRGGRSTHAALLAAAMLEGLDDMFMAFATDGVDGASGAAGAVVDGGTIDRGGDPSRALHGFDSARYLAGTEDLVITGPTGTNVADVWILWRV